MNVKMWKCANVQMRKCGNVMNLIKNLRDKNNF